MQCQTVIKVHNGLHVALADGLRFVTATTYCHNEQQTYERETKSAANALQLEAPSTGTSTL
jgi:hypothetical protein